MNKIGKSLRKNREWVFSGIGTAIVMALWGILDRWHFFFAILVFGSTFYFLSAFFDFLKRKDFCLYIKSKIREVMHLFLGDKRISIAINYKYDSYELNARHEIFVDLLKDFICYN